MHGNATPYNWHACATTASSTTSAATSPKELSATSMDAVGRCSSPADAHRLTMPIGCTGVEVASTVGPGASVASVGSVGLLPPEVAPLRAAGEETSRTSAPCLSSSQRRRALLHSHLASPPGCTATRSRFSVVETRAM
eukprot:scaffold35474_cov60-Phaeocystis_antarctica.AAC.4